MSDRMEEMSELWRKWCREHPKVPVHVFWQEKCIELETQLAKATDRADALERLLNSWGTWYELHGERLMLLSTSLETQLTDQSARADAAEARLRKSAVFYDNGVYAGDCVVKENKP